MDFAQITGIDADRIFGRLGVRYFQVRYEEMVLIPDPLVSDDTIQLHTEFGSQLQDSEGLKTYRVSCDRTTLTLQLAQYRETQAAQYLALYTAGTISLPQYEHLVNNLNKIYSLTRILAPKTHWFLSSDKGQTWIPLRSLTQEQTGAVRYTIKLVALGIEFNVGRI